MAFTHLHLHTEYSLLDGIARIKQVTAKAKELGMPALAITDHGNMYGLVSFYDAVCAFNKEAKDLNIAESATLAAIPKSPNYFNPFENPKASKERQELVIDQMVKYGFITEAQGEAAKKEELKLCSSYYFIS